MTFFPRESVFFWGFLFVRTSCVVPEKEEFKGINRKKFGKSVVTESLK